MVQFPAKLSPLTPHHRNTLMLQTPTKLAKNWGPKKILLILTSVRQCETEPPEQVWPDISMRGDAGGAPSLSAPHWAECADDGRISTNLLPVQPSPARPSTVMRDEKKPALVCKWCVQCCEDPDFVQKVSLFMRNLEATVSVFLSKLARNNYSEQSAPSPQSAATAETGAGEKMSENNNNH